MNYCKEHPDYQGLRRPRVECLSCWRLFLENKDTTVETYASAIEKQDKDLYRWLVENIDGIIYAPLEESDAPKEQKASFKTEMIFVQETKKEDEAKVEPVKGFKV